MVLTGDPISASRAEELGFVNVLVDDPRDVLTAAHTLAGRIVANAPIAVRLGLQLVNDSTLASDDENWGYSTQAFRTLMKTEDYYEGPKAFVEKRAPRWTGKMKPKL
jgi:enoyl-CoA hydratase